MPALDDLIAASRKAAPEDQQRRTAPPPGAVIFCDRLVRIFSVSGVETQALQGLDLEVTAGELTALVGASGSGKSTLLNILAALDQPTGGQAVVAGHDLLTLGAAERLAYRRATVGFIWQQTSRNLLSHFTAAENIALPMKLAGASRADRRRRGRAARASRPGRLHRPADRRAVRRPAAAGGRRRGPGQRADGAAGR